MLVASLCVFRAVLHSGSLPRTRGPGTVGSGPCSLCVRSCHQREHRVRGGLVCRLCTHDGRWCWELVAAGRSASAVTPSTTWSAADLVSDPLTQAPDRAELSKKCDYRVTSLSPGSSRQEEKNPEFPSPCVNLKFGATT